MGSRPPPCGDGGDVDCFEGQHDLMLPLDSTLNVASGESWHRRAMTDVVHEGYSRIFRPCRIHLTGFRRCPMSASSTPLTARDSERDNGAIAEVTEASARASRLLDLSGRAVLFAT